MQCDIREWQSLIELIDTTFITESTLPKGGEADGAAGGTVVGPDSSNFIVVALSFLKRLLSQCENKRYFQAFEVTFFFRIVFC